VTSTPEGLSRFGALSRREPCIQLSRRGGEEPLSQGTHYGRGVRVPRVASMSRFGAPGVPLRC